MPVLATLLQDALHDKHTHIVFGNLGRRYSVLSHRLKPFLLPLTQPLRQSQTVRVQHLFQPYVLQFTRFKLPQRTREIQLVLEPPFGYPVPIDNSIVFTSSLNLTWWYTRVKIHHYHDGSLHLLPEKNNGRGTVVITPKPYPTLQLESIGNDVSVDLKRFDDPHELYLSLLSFYDDWSDSMFRYKVNFEWPDRSVLQRLDTYLDDSRRESLPRDFWKRYLIVDRWWNA